MVANVVAWLFANLLRLVGWLGSVLTEFSSLTAAEFGVLAFLVGVTAVANPTRALRDYQRGRTPSECWLLTAGLASTVGAFTANFCSWIVPSSLVGFTPLDIAIRIGILGVIARLLLDGLLTKRRGWPGPRLAGALFLGGACYLRAAWGLPTDETRLPFLAGANEATQSLVRDDCLAAANREAATWIDAVWGWQPTVRKLSLQPLTAQTSTSAGLQLVGVVEQSRARTLTIPTPSQGFVTVTLSGNATPDGSLVKSVVRQPVRLTYHPGSTWWRSPLVAIAWKYGRTGRVTRWELLDGRMYVWLETTSLLQGRRQEVYAMNCTTGEVTPVADALPPSLRPDAASAHAIVSATLKTLQPPSADSAESSPLSGPTPKPTATSGFIDSRPPSNRADGDESQLATGDAPPHSVNIELQRQQDARLQRMSSQLEAIERTLSQRDAKIASLTERIEAMASSARTTPSSSPAWERHAATNSLQETSSRASSPRPVGQSWQVPGSLRSVTPIAATPSRQPVGSSIRLNVLFEQGADVNFSRRDAGGRPVFSPQGGVALQSLMAAQFPVQFRGNLRAALQTSTTLAATGHSFGDPTSGYSANHSWAESELTKLLLERWRLHQSCNELFQVLGQEPGVYFTAWTPPPEYGLLKANLERWLGVSLDRVAIDQSGQLIVEAHDDWSLTRLSPVAPQSVVVHSISDATSWQTVRSSE